MDTPGCSLNDDKVRRVLDRLHREARSQGFTLVRVYLSHILRRILGRTTSVVEETHAVKDLYLPLSSKQGTFCYQIARSLAARRIVEFGTSFGVSTIYLAAAVRDNGGGIVLGSALEPQKVAGARANLAEAGLAEYIEVGIPFDPPPTTPCGSDNSCSADGRARCP